MLFVSPDIDVWPYFIATAVQGVAYTALSIVLFFMFVAQCIRTFRNGFDEDYDQQRLRNYYDLVQRLVTPARSIMRRAVLNDGSFSGPMAQPPERRPMSLWRFMRRTFLFSSAVPSDPAVDDVLVSSPNTNERHPLLMSPAVRQSVRAPRPRMKSSKSITAIEHGASSTPSRVSVRISTAVWTHEDYAALEEDVVDLNDAFKDEEIVIDGEQDDGTFWGKFQSAVANLFWKAKLGTLRKLESMRHNFVAWMEKKPEPPPVHTLYEQDGDFHFPSRVLMTCATSIVVVVIIAMVMISKLYEFLKGSYLDYPAGLKRSAEQGLLWTLIGSSMVAFAVTIFSWSSMLKSYRSLVLELRRGTSPAPVDKSSYSIFFSSAYVGYQIAHSVLGFVVILVLVMFLVSGLSSLVTSEVTRAKALTFLKTTFLTWLIRQVLSWTVYASALAFALHFSDETVGFPCYSQSGRADTFNFHSYFNSLSLF